MWEETFLWKFPSWQSEQCKNELLQPREIIVSEICCKQLGLKRFKCRLFMHMIPCEAVQIL